MQAQSHSQSMLQPCPRNVGPAGFWNGTSDHHGNEDGLPTLWKQRCKKEKFCLRKGVDGWIAEVAAYDHWMRTVFNFRRMIRCVVSAPDGICWGDPWHEIVHIWIQRVREVVGACHTKTWAGTCASEHGKYACHTMNFPHERWVRRMLHWAKRASIRMATACEKGGQETKHMGHKN